MGKGHSNRQLVRRALPGRGFPTVYQHVGRGRVPTAMCRHLPQSLVIAHRSAPLTRCGASGVEIATGRLVQ